MPIACKLRVLHAKVNLKRAEQGQPPLSLRRLAGESGVSLSVVAALSTGQSQRIDYATIDRLLNYFSGYFIVTTSDLLTWEPGRAKASAGVLAGETDDTAGHLPAPRRRPAHQPRKKATGGKNRWQSA